MDWIHSYRGVANHPKTKRVTRRLGINRAHTIGILHALWYHAIDTANGDTLDEDWDDLAEECFWDGDATELVNALTEAGWLHPAGGRKLRLHDWWEYGGRTVIAAEAARLGGLKGAHKRYHTTVKAPTCQWCYPQPTEAESAPTDPTEDGANTPDSNPPTRPPIGGLIAEREEREDKKEPHTHPLETQQGDAQHRLACVWNQTRTPTRKQLDQAKRALDTMPELGTLTDRDLRRITAWAKTNNTQMVTGLPHIAPSWPHWPRSTRPLPPWCGTCDQHSRILIEDNEGRPCPNCTTTEALA